MFSKTTVWAAALLPAFAISIAARDQRSGGAHDHGSVHAAGGMPLMAGLGDRHHPITTMTPLAQLPAVTGASNRVHADSDAAPAEIRFGSVRLDTNLRLSYAETGSPGGDPVILLHGVTDSWFSFSRLLPLLPETAHVYALDQRGHGDSDRPQSSYAPRDLAQDVVAFMNTKGIARATVVGHSMGSYVAQQFTVVAPARVARLVLIGSSTTPRTINDFAALDEQVQALTDPIPVTFIREFQQSTVHAPVPSAFMDRVIAESRKAPAHVWRAAFAGMRATDAPTELSQHRIPTLILWGDRDQFMPRDEQDALIAQHGTAQLRIYSETGHAPHWERPEEVARDIAEFLR